jgi:hypothetical protein
LPPPSSFALSFGIGTACTVDGDSTAKSFDNLPDPDSMGELKSKVSRLTRG